MLLSASGALSIGAHASESLLQSPQKSLTFKPLVSILCSESVKLGWVAVMSSAIR